MTLRMKKDGAQRLPDAESAESRPSQRIPLPHNSMFVMGPETNKKWLHGINHDNRPLHMKNEAEQQEAGERISLTFRHIGTYLTKDSSKIYGQGAKAKAKEKARPVVNGTQQAADLIWAFGKENGRSDFNWNRAYGVGFDVLHFNPDE